MSVIRWTNHHGYTHSLSVGAYPGIDEFRLDLRTPDDLACSNLTREAARELHEALGDYLDDGAFAPCTHPTADVATLGEREPWPIPACACDQEPYQ